MSRHVFSSSRQAFTLVELLVVIAVIATLAALLIPLVGYAKTTAKKAQTEAKIGTIRAALSQYKDVNGHYPEAFGTLFSGNPDAQTLSNKNTWDLIGRDLQLQLQTIDRDNFRDKNDDQNHINRVPDVLRDSFVGAVSGKMIRYRPAKYYPFLTDDKNKDRVAIDSETPPNPDSYQLWSAGPDGKDQFGQTLNNKKSDDIANWKTQ
jgi:prepilin-type N-terminal cleavage/methylation domain-containing protein